MKKTAKYSAWCIGLCLLSPLSIAEQVIDADVVIVGGGLSGLAAAVTAQENGVKTIVLEKMAIIGGAGNYPEGSLGIGTRIQKKEGINITPEKVFERVMEFHHWRVNAPVIRTLLNHSGETIDWLEDIGVKFKGIKTTFPAEKSLYTWHIYQGSGSAAIKVLATTFKQKGGEIFTETPAQKLLFDEQGGIKGVAAKNSAGETIIFNAGNVVLSTGGFASNKEMLAKYVPDINTRGMEKVMYRGPEVDGRAGDGINMALSAKAALAGMGTLAGNSPYLDDEPAIYQFMGPDHMKQARAALSQPFLWVNKHGERFYNESAGSNFSDVYNALTANDGLMYSVFDEKMKQRMIDSGPLTPFNAIVVPGQKMTALDEGIAKGLKTGYAFKADSIEALAEKIKVDPAKLKETINKVNQYSDNKYDPDFSRKPEHLVRFDTRHGPYYALKGLRAFFLTLGGVKVNTHMQALDDNGDPINGLYVTGQDIGGLYDSTYDLLAEGSASSFALTSGRLAARHIADHKK
ncbi:FAD-dependent oxidoreductase [Brenneria corticis]|uniref:FAD-binding dehydrogenase n=1 Tax=Brenneria corticis TaxID=2173106 RepID=A0A2U1TYR2_9GAMM|nr:FAD-dependent oxidoreductase [Brenneria sp. CFCC 11842]PWC14547.1 FAD-binding dehydrogenase [Brenneria sp. CFCC 11842]